MPENPRKHHVSSRAKTVANRRIGLSAKEIKFLFIYSNIAHHGVPLSVIDGASRNPSEGKRWKGRIYSIVTGDQAILDAYSDAVLRLPAVPECLSALVYSVPVQLFAHHVAMEKFRRAKQGRG